ncbi:hypothetical protein [Morganella morganii]|uniref:hypothetical protein n=1 Tax=Morganella morganii TaxID=582 RepID=UPI001FFD1ACC|nr:hypothetical protein [Morganella morganii]
MANVGEIVYQVQMDVAQLLTSQRQLDQRLRNMEGRFNRTTTAVNGTERSMALSAQWPRCRGLPYL